VELGGILVTVRPEASMVRLDSTQAPVSLGSVALICRPSGPNANVFRLEGVGSIVETTGAMRCARTSCGMATWTATKTARVIAIAMIVRRSSMPTVTPSAKAKAA
jgi:hypothetical protein